MQGILQVSHSCWKTLSGVGPFEAATSWNEKKMKRHLFSWKEMRWTSINFTHLTHDPVWKWDFKSTRIDRSTLAFVVSRCESAESAESKSGAPESIRQGVTHFPYHMELNSSSIDLRPRGLKITLLKAERLMFFSMFWKERCLCSSVARSYPMSFKWPKPDDFL